MVTGECSNPPTHTGSSRLKTNTTALVRLENVTKRYGATVAVSKVNFACHSGEIHAVLGENGAGKSTLMKLLSGVIQPTEGELYIDETPVVLSSPRKAIDLGLICMFQELSLVPDLSVKENLLLGGKGSAYGFSRQTDIQLARTLLDQIDGQSIRLSTRVSELSLAERQQVEIAKALSRKPRLLILDEATSALNASVVEKVFELIRVQRDSGTGILFISHRFHEIEAIADKISVFRNGTHIDTFANGEHDYPAIINKMVGQTLTELFPTLPPLSAEAKTVLNIDSLSWNTVINDISLTVREGEILGLGGLDGQGQSSVMQALFGLLKGTTGQVAINGTDDLPTSPKSAKSLQTGLAWVPEDRKAEGLILDQSIVENMELAALGHASNPDLAVFSDLMDALDLKYQSLDQPVSDLSGGNQQKVALIKWLVISPKCLLLSDPTRGIDVKTKTQIYGLLKTLSESGMAVILLSSDYEELIHLCHKVHIFYDGTVVESLSGESLNAQNIIAASLNMHQSAAPAHA